MCSIITLKSERYVSYSSYFRFKFLPYYQPQFTCMASLTTELTHSEMYQINHLTCFNLNGYSTILCCHTHTYNSFKFGTDSFLL